MSVVSDIGIFTDKLSCIDTLYNTMHTGEFLVMYMFLIAGTVSAENGPPSQNMVS
jgi:hypothetical protein